MCCLTVLTALHTDWTDITFTSNVGGFIFSHFHHINVLAKHSNFTNLQAKMLSNCIFSFHFSYHEWGGVYCQTFKNHLYPLILAHFPIVLLGFYWFILTLHILRILVFCDKYLISKISSCLFFMDAIISWNSLILILLILNSSSVRSITPRMGADLFENPCTPACCVYSNPASVIMGER